MYVQWFVVLGARLAYTAPPSGRYVMQLPTTPPDPYNTKYKAVWLCLQILTRGLSGNYVNFGVFDLYGDPALKV